MVMRAISSFSVGPTVSESILMARRRASEATRLSTPGLFSTYATSVCMRLSLSLWFSGGLYQRVVRPADHVMQRSAGSHHGIHRIFLFHSEVDQYRFLSFARRANRRYHFGSRGDALSANTKGVGQRRKIGSDQRRGDITLIVEK